MAPNRMRTLSWLGAALVVAVLLVLYLPFIVMLLLSFQGPRGGPYFPLEHPTYIWYYKLFRPGHVPEKWKEFYDVGEFLGNYWGALWVSFRLGILTTVISTTLAFLAATGFRKAFRGASALFYLFLLGMVTPGIIISLGLFLFFDQVIGRVGVRPSPWTSGLAGHVLWAFPFCFIVFLVMYNRFDPSLEEAARNLGANPIVAFFTVTVPVMQPAILSSMLFGFTLSYDEYARSLLLMGRDQTLPLLILATLNIRITPTVYALGTITTILSFSLIGLYLVLYRLSARRGPRERFQEAIR